MDEKGIERYEDRRAAYQACIKLFPLTTDDLSGEVWRDIDGYQISNFGRLKSFKRGKPKILIPLGNTKGYLCYSLYRDGSAKKFLAHVLVAQNFIPNPDNKPQINHRDGNKLNNHVSNLEWVTQSENMRHAVNSALIDSGGDCFGSKATDELARHIREIYQPHDKNFGARALARKFGLSKGIVLAIVHGERYKNAGGNFREHDFSHGKKVNLKKKRPPLLSADQRDEIKRLHVSGSREFGIRALAKKFNVSRTTIKRVVDEK